MFFSKTRLGDELVDVLVRDGTLERIGPAGHLDAPDGHEVFQGGWLTPPMAEPHVHLDAALLGARHPNRSGTLREGIANWAALRPGLTADDVRERALQTAEMYASTGTLRIRTHVDTGSLLAVETLVGLKGELASRGIELEVVAFPQEGIFRAPGREAQWAEAVALGCDAVGGIPHFERTTEEGWRSVRRVFDLAESLDRKVDFHCDETDDPHSRNLEVVCAEAIDRGFAGRVVTGHCTALHSYNHPHAEKVMELVATAGVQVVANPLDNVVLQGRYDRYPRRRGITRVDELWRFGSTVGIGHDSVQDPWYRLGTARMLDAAYMLVHVAQLTSEEAMERAVATLWTENHLPFGDVPVLAEGAPARMLWWPVDNAADLLIQRPDPRVFR
ncbi:MAG: amidohydrolase family protein [Myxococcales bacterium]|nr:amidohydrolase family protein [Myxococcales bacterium]MCB9692191.1 amidohydrolase family protein [Alphaproteobacteria bacterium]